MTALTPADRSRLVSILGMLASDFEGERASAGLLATRLLKQRGLQWADVIGASAERPPRVTSGGVLWHADLALAERHISYCRPWEQSFVASIVRRHTLSTKQRLVLSEIATALRARGLT